MSEVSKIADQLQRSHQGPAWHGPSLGELLKGVDAQLAGQRPLGGAHNIWELVLHVTAWQTAASRAVRGETMPELTDSQDWPAIGGTEDDWRQAVKQLESSHQELVASVAQFPDERLGAQVPGRNFPFFFLLHGVAQHNAYHAGQMALLKKLRKA